jgi:hypothetical protein
VDDFAVIFEDWVRKLEQKFAAERRTVSSYEILKSNFLTFLNFKDYPIRRQLLFSSKNQEFETRQTCFFFTQFAKVFATVGPGNY